MSKCWLCENEGTEYYLVSEFYTDEYGTKHAIGTKPCKRKYCKDCYETAMQKHKSEQEEYARLKKALMYERALRSFESQDVDIYEYKEAFEAVQDLSTTNPDKFDSSEEMIAAAILIYNHIETKVHYKVGRYEVDFLLPELKVALEIDGDRHKNRSLFDSERDIVIRGILGTDWEIIRIPTNYIDSNAKELPNAIESLYNNKKELRAKNNGFIPDWFSADDSYKYGRIKQSKKK